MFDKLIQNLKEPKLAAGHRLNLTGSNFKEDGKKILDALSAAVQKSKQQTAPSGWMERFFHVLSLSMLRRSKSRFSSRPSKGTMG